MRALAAIAACLAVCLASGTAQAATVNATCADLQSKITAANDGDVIVLAAGSVCTGTSYTLPTSHAPSYSITVEGGGAGATLDGTGAPSRIMNAAVPSGKQLNVTIRNLTFRDGYTSSGGNGAAISVTGEDVSLALDGDRFLANHSINAGGAVEVNSSSATRAVSIRSSTFGDGTAAGANVADQAAGAVSVVDGNPGGPAVDVAGSTFAGNASMNGGAGALFITSESGLTLSDDTFDANRSPTVGGGADIFSNKGFTLRRNSFTRNVVDVPAGAYGRGAGLYADGTNVPATQEGNRFDGNSITRGSQSNFTAQGGGEFVDGFKLTSTGDRFTNNSIPAGSGNGEAEGGGLAVEGCANIGTNTRVPIRLENAIAAGNSAGADGHGAGVYVGGCDAGPVDLTVLDSTIAGNQTSGAGAVSGLSGGPDDSLVLRNSIVAANGGGPDLIGFGAGLTATSDDACMPAAPAGPGNFCANPLLVNPGPAHADVHETSASPTVDRGTNADVPAGLATDFEGQARILGAAVDIGADELLDKVAPAFAAASMTFTKFAVDPKGSAETPVVKKAKKSRKKKAPRGTSFVYSLSEPGRVVFTIERQTPGRKVKSKKTKRTTCVKATKKNRKKKKCKHFVLTGRFAAAGAAGKNTKPFSGRIGTKKLKPGSYRATLVATDVQGNRSAAKVLTFKVVKK